MFAQQNPSSLNVETLTSRFEASTLDAGDLLVAGIALVAGFVVGAMARSATRRVLLSTTRLQPATRP